MHRQDHLFIIIAALSFGINLVGTLLFCGAGHHGHSHSGPSHSHGSHSHSHKHNHAHDRSTSPRVVPKSQLYDANQWAVFLHFAVDSVSSFIVLATGLILEYGGTARWILYVDPVASLLIVVVILITAVPLVTYCANIVLQSAPPSLPTSDLLHDLSFLPHVSSVSALHVWALNSEQFVTAVHFVVDEAVLEQPTTQLLSIRNQAKVIFSRYNIKFSTVEFERAEAGQITIDPHPLSGSTVLRGTHGEGSETSHSNTPDPGAPTAPKAKTGVNIIVHKDDKQQRSGAAYSSASSSKPRVNARGSAAIESDGDDEDANL